MLWASVDRKMCRFSYYAVFVLVYWLVWDWETCQGSLGFDIHHRFSEPVRAMLNVDDVLPEMGTVEFYSTMVHRDRFLHARRLAGKNPDDKLTTLTFADANVTIRHPTLGFLYYANVSVGTPASWYLVALDTGSGLFWLPCDCTPNCKETLQLTPIVTLELNRYSLKTSATGKQLSCQSPLCWNRISCSSSQINCPYSISYVSSNTSSTGYLVEDVLHLTADAHPSAIADARIAFGCGVKQTGSFLEAGAPNGLLGLSMDDISVPSMLASVNLISNSFSMCFTKDGIGRISFGDKGSIHQSETPFNPDPDDLYNVSITHISTGTNVSATQFTALFDTGSSFTLLADPAYTVVSEMFDSQAKDRRLMLDAMIPFEYCYVSSSSMKNLTVPAISLTMEGGHQFNVKHPAIAIPIEGGRTVYCLAVVKSTEFDSGKDANIIGENFMTGYRVVFDREKMALGWIASDCDETVTPGTQSRANGLSVSKLYCLFIVIAHLVQVLSIYQTIT